MTVNQSKLNNERCEINSLLSNPHPENVLWKSQMIVKLDIVARLLGLELEETKKKEDK